MEIVGWIVNTAAILFLAGLVVRYGQWVGKEIMSIKQTLAAWAEPIKQVNVCERRIGAVEKNLAVHCASPHCGEEKKQENS